MTTQNETSIENNAPESESPFFVVRTVRKAVDACAETLKGYNDKYLGKTLEKGKNLRDDLKEKGKSLRDDLKEKGESFRDGVKKDAAILRERFLGKGKELIPEVPSAKKVEEKVGGVLNAVTEKINLPSKEDMERLSQAMEALNTKVDALDKKQAA